MIALTEVLTLVFSSGEKAAAAKIIFSGNYGFLFIWVYIIIGLAIPLLVLVKKQEAEKSWYASACCGSGFSRNPGYALCYCDGRTGFAAELITQFIMKGKKQCQT